MSNDNELVEVTVRRIVVPMGDVARLVLQVVAVLAALAALWKMVEKLIEASG